MGTKNAAVVPGDLATQVIISGKGTPLMPIVQGKVRVHMKKIPPEPHLNFNQSAAGEPRMRRTKARSEAIHHVFNTFRGAVTPSGGNILNRKPGRDVGDLQRRGSTACLTYRLAVSGAGIAPPGKGPPVPNRRGPPEPARPDNGASKTILPHERKMGHQPRRKPRMLPFVTFATETEDLIPRDMQRKALGC